MIAGAAMSFIVAAALTTSYFRLRAIDPHVTMEFGEVASGKQALLPTNRHRHDY